MREGEGRTFRVVPLLNGGARIDVEVGWCGANLRTLGVPDGPTPLRGEIERAERRGPLEVIVATDPDDEVRMDALVALDALDPQRSRAVAPPGS